MRKKNFLGLMFGMLLAGVLTGCNEVAQLETIDYEDLEDNPEISGNANENIEETTVLETGTLRVIAKDITYTEDEMHLNLSVENSGSEEEVLYFGNVRVNGYQVNATSTWSEYDAAMFFSANQYYEEPVIIKKAELTALGIEEIADISFTIGFRTDLIDEIVNGEAQDICVQLETGLAKIYDYEKDYLAKALEDGSFAKAKDYEMEYYSTDVLWEESGICIRNAAVFEEESGQKVLFFEAVNTSEEEIHFEVSEYAINKLVMKYHNIEGGSSLYLQNMFPKTHYQVMLPVSKDILDMLQITALGTLDYTVKAYDVNEDKILDKDISVKVSDVKPFEVLGEEIYNEGGIRVWYAGSFSEYGEYSTRLEPLFIIENGTSCDITLRPDYEKCKINGINVMMYFGTYPAGKTSLAMPGASILEEDVLIDATDIESVHVEFEMETMEMGEDER